MATLAFFQNRLGRTDGVSLEVDKWRAVLRDQLGHRVLYCSGNAEVAGNHVLPELYAQHPVTWKILQSGTVAFRGFSSEAELEELIYKHADTIERKLLEFLEREKVDLLLPNNLCSGGYQPAAAIAFHRVLRRTGLPAIIHSHDFYFEESGEVRATCQVVASIYERYFPTRLPQVQHVVINRIAQRELKRRKNIEAKVVPNVFDFDQPVWAKDDYNRDFRSRWGIGPDDLLALQATRILDRKGIELAIDLIAELGRPERRLALRGTRTAAGGHFGANSKVVLLCAGIVESIGISGNYWPELQRHAAAMNVDLRHVGDAVRHSREHVGGAKGYSLWDSYVHADFVTYPSTWEGWGNQFIEAVFAQLPVVVFEYPVWRTDLGPEGFEVISLGSELDARRAGESLVRVPVRRLEAAATELIEVLLNPDRRRAMVTRNFAIARERFSLHSLRRIIEPLVQAALNRS